MRLTETKIQSLTDQLVAMLSQHPQVNIKGNESKVAFKIKTVILNDLRREDNLDDEVRELLEAALKGKNRVSLDYNTLFKKAKAQLIRERRLVI